MRALSILKELLTTAEEEPEESEDEDVLSALSRVQSVVDTLESPLFSSLLEIRDQYLKVRVYKFTSSCIAHVCTEGAGTSLSRRRS